MKRLLVWCLFVAVLVGVGCAMAPSEKPADTSIQQKVFVVRHAESYKNLKSPPAGMSNEQLDSLTPAGVEQATKAGLSLKGKQIAAVFCSPTGRTRQTAQIISEQVGLGGAVSEDPALKSMKKGKTPEGEEAGMTWRKKQWSMGMDPRTDGGESLEDATNRAVSAIEGFIAQYPGKSIVVVTHSDICATLAGQAKMTPFAERYKMHGVGYAGIIEIGIGPKGEWTLL